MQRCDYAEAKAKLFRRAKRFNDGQKEMSCDQIIVQHFTGNEENVVIFESGKSAPYALFMKYLYVLYAVGGAIPVATCRRYYA